MRSHSPARAPASGSAPARGPGRPGTWAPSHPGVSKRIRRARPQGTVWAAVAGGRRAPSSPSLGPEAAGPSLRGRAGPSTGRAGRGRGADGPRPAARRPRSAGAPPRVFTQVGGDEGGRSARGLSQAAAPPSTAERARPRGDPFSAPKPSVSGCSGLLGRRGGATPPTPRSRPPLDF